MEFHNGPRRLAVAVPHLYAARQEYRGGWPAGYLGADCPADIPVRCKRTGGFSNLNCCPPSQFCTNDMANIYCCPTDSDCGTAVYNRPACANSTWTLYKMPSGGFFCCPTGYVGVLPVSGYTGLCEDNIDGLPPSRIATPATQGTTSRPTGPATASGTGLPPSQQTTTTTTPSNTPGSDDRANRQSSPSGIPASGDSTGPSSIPTGAVAGLAIGGVLLLLLGAALLLWLHRRSLRRHQQSLPPPRGPRASAEAVEPAATQARPQQITNFIPIPHGDPAPPPAYSHAPAVSQAVPPRGCRDGAVVMEGQVEEVGGTPRAELSAGRA